MSFAKYPQFSDFGRRYNTFTGFPHPSVEPLTHFALADAGLFFGGVADETTCFHCGGRMRAWAPNDSPYEEHAKWIPGCEFIRKKQYEILVRSTSTASPPQSAVGHDYMMGDDEGYVSMPNGRDQPRNYTGPTDHVVAQDDVAPSNAHIPPIRAPDVCGFGNTGFLRTEAYATTKAAYAVPHLKPAFPRYATLASRERSFETYPTTAKGNKERMAKAGFFYTGVQDRTTCFQCGNSLCSWVDEDDPLVEHARWYPKCAYVELMLGDETINNVRKTHRNILAERQAKEMSLSNEDTEFILRELKCAPCVHRLLHQSIDPVIMELAIRKRLNGTGIIDVLDEQDLRKALADVVSLPENVRTKEVSKAETGSLTKCTVCTVGERNCMFLPCSHLVACTRCAARCSACPTCNRQVVTRMNVFLA